MPPLGKNDHAVLVFHFCVVVNNSVSPKTKTIVRKANIRKVLHSTPSVDRTIKL